MNEFIEFAQKLADASGHIIKENFRTSLVVDTKPDRTPITIADRNAEISMREMIEVRYPDHGIIGEEFETINPEAEYQWVLDPIDGTKTYVSGTFLFGTLIALLKEGIPILGVINNPVTNQFLVGDGAKTWLNGNQVKVRKCSSIHEATLLVTSHWSVGKYRNGPAFDILSRNVKLYRTWGDCHGYFLVATGYADIMIDPIMHLWDVAPLIPIIRGAGGRITDYYGGDPLKGEGVVATAGLIHDKVIGFLNP